ncbi:GTP pyrophosphokinase [Alteromonas gilva]|uniref:GTP pyrophosphokinase n=1 Tax=Alteromonas gilva TaxID=2987522 RepID=A0ABT5KXA1_9ALTE|nr:GTP pyrophosphokinase [Alteromonas gilva]MDC8829381.1 GTP pyrophosphokinase [Alteromonas gilva]
MSLHKHENWLDIALPKHRRLTDAVVTILENLLNANSVEYLAVTGRTKEKESALEKIKRKGYKNPGRQLTDISGIRVIVYFESDVKRVSDLIESSFSIDKQNSLNQDDLMSTDQIGYRSVHFVCDLGKQRGALPEFEEISDLKFEFQVRTVLQHAWAELAHDRNYKFSGKLPKEIERELFLYAGMLEIADRGFDTLSTKIDNYIKNLNMKSQAGDLATEINSISLPQFVEKWCQDNNVILELPHTTDQYSELVGELNDFGVQTLEQLNNIIPPAYAEAYRRRKHETTIYGLVRDWMLIHDWRKFVHDVEFNWVMAFPHIYDEFIEEKELEEFLGSFEWDVEDYDTE